MTTRFYPGWKASPVMYTYAFNIRDRETAEFLFVSEDWKDAPEDYAADAKSALDKIVEETGNTNAYIEDTRKKHRLR